MKFRQKHAAKRNGSNNSATAPAPAATNGATPPPPAASAFEAAFEARLAEMLKGVPPFIRLPKPGERCPFTSLSRGAFYELVAPSERNRFRPAVRATYRKARRLARRGIWIVPSANLFRHLLALEADSVERFVEDSQARTVRLAEKRAEPQAGHPAAPE